jgi:aryl-alcohol dehydrogenase-like predicted oxidoreductase
MRYRQLGSSDLRVSAIALGTWLTTSGGLERGKAIACVRRALDLGITFIDTANVYGRGVSEIVLAEALANVPRQSYVLATKLYFPMSDVDRGLSRAQILKQIDASLARLKVDYVDLYQCHRYDAQTPLTETMAALTEVVRAGKARYLGFSEWPADRIAEATAMAGVEKFVSSQPQYSMLWRKPEAEVVPFCRTHGISQIVWSPLAQGVLTGKYRPGAPVPSDSRAASPTMGTAFRRAWLERPALEAVDRLRPLAAQAGLSLAQFALAWVLRNTNVAAAIVGASRPEQLDENAAAADATVDPALFTAAERILADAGAVET